MKTWLIVVSTFVAILAGALFHYGAFIPIEFQDDITPAVEGVGLLYTGPFNGVGDTYNKLYEDLKAQGIDETQYTYMSGLMCDDPDLVPEEKLRTLVIAHDIKNVDKIKGDFVRVSIPPAPKAFSTSFPMKSPLLVSIIIAVNKVYPAMDKYVKEQGLTEQMKCVLEICDDEKTIYSVPLVNQEKYLAFFE